METAYELADCPACGDARAVALADRDTVRREMEVLWEFHLRRVRRGVPLERLKDRVVFSQPPPLRLAGCHQCGTVYRDPRDRPRSVTERYALEYESAATLDRLMALHRGAERRRVRRLTAVLGRTGRGLEVGPYACAFLAEAADAGWRFEGMDVNDDVVAHARRHGLTVRQGTIHDADPTERWDAVALWTCLDQLPDPRAAVRAAAVRVAPGGVLAVRVPNGAFYSRLRAVGRTPITRRPARAALAWNNLLGFPYLQAFTVRALHHMVAAEGLRPVRTLGDALVPLSDRWTRTWAVWEERMIKALLRPLPAPASPWLELYARQPTGA